MTEHDQLVDRTSFDTFQREIIAEFRRHDGRVGGMFAGATLALLTTIGARSRRRRTTPLAYLDLEGTPAVVGSAMGAPSDPDWVHNVRANPAVTVETGTETYEAIATVHIGEERDRLFALVIDRDPGFADYQQRTTRPLPVVTFQRVETGTAWTRGLGDFVVESHDWLRGELTAVRDALDAAGPIDVARLGDRLRSHCLSLCSGLTEHHTGEDRGAFPVLADRFPGLAPLLDELVRDHERIAECTEALHDLARRHRAGTDDPALLRAELDRLTGEFDRHFDHEERNLVAPLNALGPAPE